MKLNLDYINTYRGMIDMVMPKDMSQARRIVTQLYGQVEELKQQNKGLLDVLEYLITRSADDSVSHEDYVKDIEQSLNLLTKYRGENG